jgi:hypothetical protein
MPFSTGVTYSKLQSSLGDSRSIFPNANATIAELRPHSQTIHLHNISGPEFTRLVSTNRWAELSTPYSVICHETMHWLDLVGTVWGQEYLVNLFDAYDAALTQRQNPEYEWWKLIRLYDEDRRVMFPKYYKVVGRERSPHNPRSPWSLNYSFGHEFSADGKPDHNRPIFFVIFGENTTRERIARQPLTVGTLLEATATWAELFTGLLAINQSTDESTKVVDRALWTKEKIGGLYDVQLTDYTGPAHLIGSITHNREMLSAYELTAALSFVCLNLTPSHFDRLQPPAKDFSSLPLDRLAAFRTSRNRGFAFACIAFSAPKGSDSSKVEEWLDAALASAGLPDFSEVMKDAGAHLNGIVSQVPHRGTMDASLKYLLEVGRSIFSHRAATPRPVPVPSLVAKDIPLPLMFDSNAEMFGIGNTALDRRLADPEVMFECEWELRKITDNFLTGCRGLS